ncbi:MAG: hypothetical protein V1862_10505 [Methanobacteriota archaeon]
MKPFTRTKVIKGIEYLYEVTPYLDPDSGKWKQRNRYLGKNVNGLPVRKERPSKREKVSDLGQYIPAFWAVRKYQILEALLSVCCPHEASMLVVLAINRLIQPCPPSNLSTWLAGTSIPKLFSCSSLETDEIYHLLQKVSDEPVARMFTRMFSNINELSDERILMTIQSPASSRSFIRHSEGSSIENHFGREFVMRIQYDRKTNILAGFEVFPLQQCIIEDSITQVISGRIPSGIIVSHWDYLSPSVLSHLVRSECSFIIRPEISFRPVASQIATPGEHLDHPANIRYYRGHACYIRPFSPFIGGKPIQGYILNNIRKEQFDRVRFFKHLKNVRVLIDEIGADAIVTEEVLADISGPFRNFFSIHDTKAGQIVKRNEEAISRTIASFGKDCVLFHGDFSWEESFNLADMRGEFEEKMTIFIRQFEQDYAGLHLDRIRRGVFFISFLTLLIRNLVENRLQSAKIKNISSFEALIAELTPIHVVCSPHRGIVPEKLRRQQKTILSYFGGIPVIATEPV